MVFSGHQPNFLPYMGVFYKMHRSDIFVLDDDVQYSNKGLHNRNFIYANGSKGDIIIPVEHRFGDEIRDVRISYQAGWQRKMLRTLQMNYGKAPHFAEVYDVVSLQIEKKHEFLCELNIELITEISAKLGIECRLVIASDEVPTELRKNERNVFQCKKLGCDEYYSGVGGKEYNDEALYEANGIKIVYSDYQPVIYRQYGSKGRPFIENLSVIDYLFNNGFVLPAHWGK